MGDGVGGASHRAIGRGRADVDRVSVQRKGRTYAARPGHVGELACARAGAVARPAGEVVARIGRGGTAGVQAVGHGVGCASHCAARWSRVDVDRVSVQRKRGAHAARAGHVGELACARACAIARPAGEVVARIGRGGAAGVQAVGHGVGRAGHRAIDRGRADVDRVSVQRKGRAHAARPGHVGELACTRACAIARPAGEVVMRIGRGGAGGVLPVGDGVGGAVHAAAGGGRGGDGVGVDGKAGRHVLRAGHVPEGACAAARASTRPAGEVVARIGHGGAVGVLAERHGVGRAGHAAVVGAGGDEVGFERERARYVAILGHVGEDAGAVGGGACAVVRPAREVIARVGRGGAGDVAPLQDRAGRAVQDAAWEGRREDADVNVEREVARDAQRSGHVGELAVAIGRGARAGARPAGEVKVVIRRGRAGGALPVGHGVGRALHRAICAAGGDGVAVERERGRDAARPGHAVQLARAAAAAIATPADEVVAGSRCGGAACALPVFHRVGRAGHAAVHGAGADGIRGECRVGRDGGRAENQGHARPRAAAFTAPAAEGAADGVVRRGYAGGGGAEGHRVRAALRVGDALILVDCHRVLARRLAGDRGAAVGASAIPAEGIGRVVDLVGGRTGAAQESGPVERGRSVAACAVGGRRGEVGADGAISGNEPGGKGAARERAPAAAGLNRVALRNGEGEAGLLACGHFAPRRDAAAARGLGGDEVGAGRGALRRVAAVFALALPGKAVILSPNTVRRTYAAQRGPLRRVAQRRGAAGAAANAIELHRSAVDPHAVGRLGFGDPVRVFVYTRIPGQPVVGDVCDLVANLGLAYAAHHHPGEVARRHDTVAREHAPTGSGCIGSEGGTGIRIHKRRGGTGAGCAHLQLELVDRVQIHRHLVDAQRLGADGDTVGHP